MKIAVMGAKSYLLNDPRISELFQKHDKKLTIDFLKNHKGLSEEHDIAFCLSYYRLIPQEFFERPYHGSFVVHASDLPKGRGWAPINWALIRGDETLFLTSIKVDAGCDSGPYHLKTSTPIDSMDTVSSMAPKVDEEIVKHILSILNDVLCLSMVTLKEQVGEPTYNERRRVSDSELDLDKTLREQWNLIRATDNDDYPAFFKLNGKKIILKYEVIDGNQG